MRLLKLLVVIAICLSVPTAAFAHPGRTDSDGGHTDHSTGEYHYHHGYSAHQHSDRDGDGDLDCPYQFNNKSKPKENTKIIKKIADYFLPIICCFVVCGVIWIIDEIKWRRKK